MSYVFEYQNLIEALEIDQMEKKGGSEKWIWD
jgi:hypothetical protein